ncbi:hypothetical protein V6N13_036966 [Hibiscus sabdariffa]
MVHYQPLAFDGSESNIPSEFIRPDDEKPCLDAPELVIPTIDLGTLRCWSDPPALSKAAEAVSEACKRHGFFLVVNHGVDLGLIDKAHQYMDVFFGLQISEKQKAQRKVGDSYGRIYQEYCEAMNKLSLQLMELVGISLGLDQSYFKDLFEENDSILRLNHYPPCQQPDSTLGTGPHSDPTSLTILHQDQLGGLQVFSDEKWHSIAPIPEAFVVNIGDTLMALTNGVYKSCIHRAVVNNRVARRSLAFFLCPKMDITVTVAQGLVNAANPRRYPDFTWASLLEFTQRHYRADMKTLDAFSKWVQQRESTEK